MIWRDGAALAVLWAVCGRIAYVSRAARVNALVVAAAGLVLVLLRP